MDALAVSGGLIENEFSEGDPVRIVSGPFEGYEAIFDARLPGTDRVQVLLAFLGTHPQRLKLDTDAIRKAKKK
ncbi:MAG: hypothetical protein R3C44_03375 [Chloroflexota bacterium]